ncbi:hypothetical protein F2Q69_00007491 [Brassica cretica]|uniref:Uncharacterized protein n=1 Tax=Brassica cretica TaxID=69181 RepID=A0A8S9P833_BRACR|nr:hypothetical protein F2Q69_00007491 [Brassica cretica]
MDAPFMFTPWISEDFWKELQEMSRLTYVFLNMLAHSHRQKLEIYTKDEINEMFYGACGEHERNKEAFQMKLDGVYYPLNDCISWLTTYMEEMKQDIARIQHEANVARPPSIDRRQPPSIDITPPASTLTLSISVTTSSITATASTGSIFFIIKEIEVTNNSEILGTTCCDGFYGGRSSSDGILHVLTKLD